jgi:hypothetical protein
MAQKPTPDYKALKAKVQELAKGPKNREAVEAMLKRLSSEGIPQKKVLSDDLFANRQDILDRVQERAEEY